MFKVVEALNDNPVRFPIKPGVKLIPGYVVKVIEYKNNLVFDRCDGYQPFGLLAGRGHGGDTLTYTKRVPAWPQRMVVHLDKFDHKNDIKSGDSLYCNRKGILTSKKPFEGAFTLAKVISPADEERKYMSILWL